MCVSVECVQVLFQSLNLAAAHGKRFRKHFRPGHPPFIPRPDVRVARSIREVKCAYVLQCILFNACSLKKIDPAFHLEHTDKVCQKSLSPKLKKFLSHCCHQRHYFFEVKKCGENSRQICAPTCIRVPVETFHKIKKNP